MDLKVPMELLRQHSLFVATPMYGGNCSGSYSKSVQDLVRICERSGIKLQMYYLFNESLITRARNYCVDEFLRSGMSRLMFIDSDIAFNANDVLALLALSVSEDNDYDVIGGPYPKKCISWEKVRMAADKGYGDPQNPKEELRDAAILERFIGDYVFNPRAQTGKILINEPVEVLEIGTGFMMVKRETFEKFEKRYPRTKYRPDHIRTVNFDGSRLITQFFQAEIDVPDPYEYLMPALQKIKELEGFRSDAPCKIAQEAIKEYEERFEKASKRYLSEDYWFCQRVIQAGLKIWFCPWMRMAHIGTYAFSGSLADLAQVGAPATADPRLLKKVNKQGVQMDPGSGPPKINLPGAPAPTAEQPSVIEQPVTTPPKISMLR